MYAADRQDSEQHVLKVNHKILHNRRKGVLVLIPWLRVSVDVLDEMMVDSSLLSSFWHDATLEWHDIVPIDSLHNKHL